MNEVIEAFRRVIPIRHKRSGRGWINFDCPACGERRGRAGFLETPTGGFRYRCQNGGCAYERGAGWEPTGGFFGRARHLFHLMDGDISEIPSKWLEYNESKAVPFEDWLSWMMSDDIKPLKPKDDVVKDFPEIDLPPKTQSLFKATGKNAQAAQQYVINRGSFFREAHAFCWSPSYPRHVIVPFQHYDKTVGWIARKIDDGKEFAHIKCQNFPKDYMLNQHEIYRYPTVLVQEGTFDAIALRGLCTFGNTLTKKQINLLNSCGREVCLIPDYQGQEWRAYWRAAKENSWYLAVPEWPGDDLYSPPDHIKDVGESIERNGRLYTLEVVMQSMTKDYGLAEQVYFTRSRG